MILLFHISMYRLDSPIQQLYYLQCHEPCVGQTSFLCGTSKSHRARLLEDSRLTKHLLVNDVRREDVKLKRFVLERNGRNFYCISAQLFAEMST